MGRVGIETSVDGPVSTVRLSGELDISGADEIERTIQEVEQTATGSLVIDLRRLEFMDSTGLRLILSADARARERGSELIVVRGPETVHRVFRIAALERRLRFVDDPALISDGDGG
ncbi:MAG TPA: STAS domain-containing protein [Actinomycetota bacterium]|jgi:anti-anti-sigma factor